MLNKLSYNLMKEINEADTNAIEIKKEVFMEGNGVRIKEIPAKEASLEKQQIKESEDLKGKEVLNELGTDSTIDKLISGDELYFRNNDGLALMIRYADNYPEPEDYDEGYTQGWERGADEEFDKEQDEKYNNAKQAAESGDVWEILEIDENTLKPNGTVAGYIYGQAELEHYLNYVREVRVVKRLEEAKKICEKCGKEICECDKSLDENIGMDMVKDIAKDNIELGKTVLGGLTDAGLVESGEDIKKDLNIEAGSDEEAELDNILDTNYNDLFDDLDDEEKEEYNKIAATIRDLKPEEALIDVIDEIESKAKENGLEKDLLIFAYLNKGKMNESAPINSDLKKGKEDRLASLKTQLEQDGDQLSDDEKKAIEDEIAQLEQEVYTESEKICEAEVTNLKTIKSQGNIYMLEDDKQFIVGENYNESESIIENAEIYSTKEEADKDYFERCGIDLKEEKVEEGVISDLKATHLAKKAAKLNKEKDFDKSTKAFAKSMEINDKSADKLDTKAKKLEDKAGKLRNEAIVKRHKTVKDFTDKK